MSDARPVSWRSIVYGTPVLTDGGEAAGTVREVLGSDGEDIFHGLRVTLAGSHRDVMVPVDDIAAMSASEIRTELSRAEIDRLPAYDEHASYHVGSVGRLRKHTGWRQDSKSDEGPG